MNLSAFVIACFLAPLPVMADAPAEKWMAPAESLKRMFPTARATEGKLILQTPHKGIRLLFSMNGGEKKLAALGEEIAVEKGQRLQVFERHVQIEILSVPTEGKTRFAAIVREDYRSFGKELTVSASVFDLGVSDIIAVPEAEGRAALKTALESKPTTK